MIDLKNNPEFQKGAKNFKEKYDESRHYLLEELIEFSPDLAEIVVAEGLYGVWEKRTPNLTIPEKEMVVFSSLVTSCTVPGEIKAHTQNLLNVGVSKQQIIELLILLTLYIGVPKVIQAKKAVQEAFAEHE
ncbi:MAG: carboxymuconolactone decarboxylase family protein [Legionellaceae bacterium]|nr:carboxymuconolactone decarboxylase family protein [Legionellaceae bacterium]